MTGRNRSTRAATCARCCCRYGCRSAAKSAAASSAVERRQARREPGAAATAPTSSAGAGDVDAAQAVEHEPQQHQLQRRVRVASVVESMGEGYGPRLGQTVPMRIVLVVPGGVDPPGSERVIPFIHGLVADLSSRHDVLVIAVGHDPEPGTWPLFDATVVNVPVGRHSKADVARVVRSVSRLAARGGRPDVVHGLWANLPGLAASVAARRHRRPSVVSVCGGEFASLADIGYGGGLSRGHAVDGASCDTNRDRRDGRDHVDERARRRARGGRVDEVIPLGADTSIFSASDSPTIANRLVHVGNINRVKDQAMLLHAFRARARDACPRQRSTSPGSTRSTAQMQALADDARHRSARPLSRLPAATTNLRRCSVARRST